MRFLVDENLPAAVADALRAEGHDAVAVVETAHRGADDDTVWSIAATQRRILVSRDRGFPHPLGRAWPPGLVLLRLPQHAVRGSLVQAIKDLLSLVKAADLAGYVTVVESGRVRRRPLALLRR